MNSFKSIVKRIGIISLSILITFTSIPVHAETEGENGQNGVTSKDSHYYDGGWSHNRQGYRFYIVNGNKERVSKVVKCANSANRRRRSCRRQAKRM